MLTRQIRKGPLLRRKLFITKPIPTDFDDFSWLRPVEVKIDDAFSELNDKIKSGTEIENNPEITEIISQMMVGGKPPKRERTLRHRELSDQNYEFIKSNPTIRLHLVIFYQKYFPDLGARHMGWRLKAQELYSKDKIEKDIQFNKRLLREKYRVEYDEVFARLVVGSSADTRWHQLKNRIDEKEKLLIESAWANISRSDRNSFEERYRNGEIDLSYLPRFSITEFLPETKIEENIIKKELQVLEKEDKLDDIADSDEKLEKYVDKYLSKKDNVNWGIIRDALMNGNVKSDSKIYNAFVMNAIRRPALGIEDISNKAMVYQNLCAIRGFDRNLVKQVIDFRSERAQIGSDFSETTEIWEKSKAYYEDAFVNAENQNPNRSAEEEKLFQEERQKAKKEVIRKKNDMLRSKVRNQLLDYKMMRDALSLPNLISPKTPKESSYVVHKNEFKRITSDRKTATDIVYDYDLGQKSHTRLTAGKFSRQLRGDLAHLMKALQNYITDNLEEKQFELVIPPPLSFDYISETLTGKSKNSLDFPKLQYKNMMHLESHNAISQLYSSFASYKFDSYEEVEQSTFQHYFYSSATNITEDSDVYHSIDFPTLSVTNNHHEADLAFEKLVNFSSKILTDLEISHRMSELPPNKMDISAYRTIGIEVESLSCPWKPYTTINQRRDYVANRLNMIYDDERQNSLQFCHTVDGVVSVTSKLFDCVLERYQQKNKTKGDKRSFIQVPKVLIPYMPNQKTEISPVADVKYWYAGSFATKAKPGTKGVLYGRGNVMKSYWPGYEQWEHGRESMLLGDDKIRTDDDDHTEEF